MLPNVCLNTHGYSKMLPRGRQLLQMLQKIFAFCPRLIFFSGLLLYFLTIGPVLSKVSRFLLCFWSTRSKNSKKIIRLQEKIKITTSNAMSFSPVLLCIQSPYSLEINWRRNEKNLLLLHLSIEKALQSLG